MMKKRTPSPEEINAGLLRDYAHWVETFKHGCSDPFWSDGVNINLIRNHILYGKRLCELALGDKFFLYPDAYYFPLPCEVPKDFMVNDRNHMKQNVNITLGEAFKFNWKEVLG